MRSPEISIGQSVSVAPRPSIAPSFSRPSFESFKPAPVASIVRHPGIFNPNISVSIGAPKLGSIGGESKPFSFPNTKPIEVPKNLPFADKKPNFSLKETQVIARNKTADTQPASDKSSKLEALFGPKLSAPDIQLKGVEKFGGMKTQLPVKPEMHSQSVLKPKESIVEHIAKLEKLPLKPKTETISKPNETIQQRIARLERIPIVPKQDVVKQIQKEQTLADRIATLEHLPLIIKTNKAESISQHIAKLEKIPLHPKVERVVAEAILERIVLKGNERFKHLEQLSLIKISKSKEEITRMMTQIKEIAPSLKTVRSEVKTSTVPLGEVVVKKDEETKALKAASEVQTLLKSRISLKKQGFTEAQLDRLLQLQLQAQKMPAEEVAKVIKTMHTLEQGTQQKKQYTEQKNVGQELYVMSGRDSKAMDARARVVDAIADRIKKERGSDVLVDGDDFAGIDEKLSPEMRSQVLKGIKKEDESLKEWKKNIRSRVRGLPLRLATYIIKKLSERTKAVEITDPHLVTEGANADDLHRVAKNGDPVNVQNLPPNLPQTYKIYYGEPIELVPLSAQQRQRVKTRQA